jgi:HK97 family phage portal protein
MANFWQNFKSFLGGTGQPTPTGGLVYVDRASSSAARGSKELIDLYHQSPWLRATVTKIAQHFAATPWHLYRVRGKGGEKHSQRRLGKELKSFPVGVRKEMIKRAVADGSVEEVFDHPLLSLWERGNGIKSGMKVRELTMRYYDIVGDAPWYVKRLPNGTPASIWPVPPTWVKTNTDKGELVVEVQWGNEKLTVPADDIIWFIDDNLKSPYGRGIGTGQALSDELDSDEYASQLIKTAFENRGLLDVIVAVEGASQPQLDRARAEFQNRHQGWLKAGVPFFHSGKADVKVVSQSFQEMQLLQLREWERDLIVSVYGVPPELLGILGKSNRATISESRSIMAEEVLIPRLEYFKSIVNQYLVPMFGDPSLMFDYEDPRPGNEEFQLKAMQAHPYSVTEREWREIQGLEDRGERDDFVWIPVGMVPYRGNIAASLTPSTEDTQASDAASTYEDTLDALPTDAPTKAMPSSAQERAVEAALKAVDERPFVQRLTPIFREEMTAAARAELTALNPAKASDDIFGDVSEYLRTFGAKRVSQINKTTKRQLAATLAEGMAEGESMDKLSARVNEVFSFAAESRADVIARTEVLRASNYATYSAQAASGLVITREWVSTVDNRTRDSHASMNGVQVPMDEPYKLKEGPNAGATALHPGDFDIAEEDIQCRCTTMPGSTLLEGRSIEHTPEQIAYWKAFDANATKWESRVHDPIRRAFEDQAKAVIAALFG